MDETVETALRECPLFADIPAALLAHIAAAADIRSFPAGQTIFREGETSDAVYVVRHGRVALEICAPGVGCRRLLSVGPGELVGWSPLLDPRQPLTATARTTEPAELLALDAKAIQTIFAEHPEVGYHLLRQVAHSLARRLTATRMQLLNLYGEEMAHAQPIDHER